jgi:thiol-disulfide isomerase/thioredoxin
MKFQNVSVDNLGLLSRLDNEKATVLVYHPQCIHCQMMREAWDNMKTQLQKKNKPCNIYEINAENLDRNIHPITRNVEGFPTIMNVNNGKVINQFEKERNVDNMIDYVLSNTPKSPNHDSSKKKINRRRVKFSLNNNGSLIKQRKVINGKTLKNSLQVHKKTLKKNKVVEKVASKNKNRGKTQKGKSRRKK